MNMEKEMTSPNLAYLCYPSQFWHGATEVLCAVWVKSIYLLVLPLLTASAVQPKTQTSHEGFVRTESCSRVVIPRELC